MSAGIETGRGTPAGALVHIVDDDLAIRDSLAWLLKSRGIASRQWEGGEAFLSGISAAEGSPVACVVLDMRMSGMDGLATLDALHRQGVRLPVVFLTGHADVPIAVDALKKGAFDFVEKPFNDNALVDRIVAALIEAEERHLALKGRDLVGGQLASLTQRENEVMELLLAGKLNKQIADQLGVSMRTVEVHRSRVFEKMGVSNAVELANLVGPLRLAGLR
jgi:two-component system response regulator DctR